MKSYSIVLFYFHLSDVPVFTSNAIGHVLNK